MRAHRLPAVITAFFAALAIVAVSATPASAEIQVGDLGTAVNNFFWSPEQVAGANDWNCTPSPAHPEPVVLVHGTFVNLGTNWVALAPMLANAGYCVFAQNYGMTWASWGRIGGLADVRTSAAQLSGFVDQVLAATGASQVDIVGHSQGGMMPHYYLENLGGAAKVRTLVGISPSNHGTDFNGVVTLAKTFKVFGVSSSFFWLAGLPAVQQQMEGSRFQRSLFDNGDTVAGPRYVVIQTKYDRVVTPYQNSFLEGPNVDNILIQDQCPGDWVGHAGMFLDGPVLANVLNELGANDPGFSAACTNYGFPL